MLIVHSSSDRHTAAWSIPARFPAKHSNKKSRVSPPSPQPRNSDPKAGRATKGTKSTKSTKKNLYESPFVFFVPYVLFVASFR
jgi:hypothetical protein